MTSEHRQSESVPDHFSPGCTCTAGGENPECPHHGYEAVIRRLRAALDRLATGVYDRLDWIERDRREPDKVLLNVSSVRSFLIREAEL